MAVIHNLESTRQQVTTRMVSNLIKAHDNNDDIAGALKAYYDTCHLAAPRLSVLGYILDKCVVNNDKVNIGPGSHCGITIPMY